MIPAHVRIFVCLAPVDFRRGFDGLALAARERLGEDPRAGGLFLFTNRRATGLKIVWVERTGCCLLSKRLHQARVVLPPGADRASASMVPSSRGCWRGCPAPRGGRQPARSPTSLAFYSRCC